MESIRRSASHAAGLGVEYLDGKVREVLGKKPRGVTAQEVFRNPLELVAAIGRGMEKVASPLGKAGTGVLEEANRVGEYKRGLKRGTGTDATRWAGYASREVTLDFSRSGYNTRQINMGKAFFNAAIQGTEKNSKAL